MFGFYVIKCYEMQKLHISSQTICICLTHAVYTNCENCRALAKTKSQSILTARLGKVKKHLSQLNATVG